MNEELFKRGLEIRKAVFGAEFVEKSIASADDFNMPLQVAIYCGVPAAVDAFRVAREAFADMERAHAQ